MSDDRLEMLTARLIRYAGRTLSTSDDLAEIERLRMTRERLSRWQQRLRQIGVVQITKAGDAVEFRVDQGSISNGDSYKGYEYDLAPPMNQHSSLDEYRISARDKNEFGDWYVTKPIRGHWYLYLFVNH
jgi:hypothetical protein